jgi:uncharacterized protein (TIGR03492 family)
MLDGFAFEPLPAQLQDRPRLLLLAGSRLPEALCNLRRLLAALPEAGSGPALHVLLATGSRPSPTELAPLLAAAGFKPIDADHNRDRQLGATAGWRRGELDLWIGPGRFSTWAPWGDLGLATAGTATEQLVGLGIGALSLPGAGPQFKPGFARRQSRLLGGAVQPCHSPTELRQRLLALLADPGQRQRLGHIGRQRMGPSGGSERLAALIAGQLLGGG